MKLEVNRKDRNPDDAVAYITEGGNLVFHSSYHGKAIWLDPSDGEVMVDWGFDTDEAETLIFPGDTITITF